MAVVSTFLGMSDLKNMKPDVVGIITARGGSKSVPRKNVTIVGGKPLVAWTIEAALGSHSLSRVIVSTDDEEIAEVSRQWGAEVPFMRPSVLAQDHSSHVSVVVHAVQWLESQGNSQPDYIMVLQPTSPFRSVKDIDVAINLALEKDADAVVSVCPTRDHPYLSKKITPDGKLLDFVTPPEGYLRRQVLPSVYSLNGAVYLVRPKALLKHHSWFTNRTYAYVMPHERSLDIDSSWDLYVADLILKNKSRHDPN